MKYVRTQSYTAPEGRISGSDTFAAATDPEPYGIPVSYNDSVTAVEPIGGKMYSFSHTIEWEINGGNYSNVVSSFKGETYDAWWEYKGLHQTQWNEYSSFFDIYRSGKFKFTYPGSEHERFPHVELRGRGDGSGSTVSKDDDYP